MHRDGDRFCVTPGAPYGYLSIQCSASTPTQKTRKMTEVSFGWSEYLDVPSFTFYAETCYMRIGCGREMKSSAGPDHFKSTCIC